MAWYENHKKFTKKHPNEIDLVIDESNFDSRMEGALKAVGKFIEEKS